MKKKKPTLLEQIETLLPKADEETATPSCPYCFSPHVIWHEDGYCFCQECEMIWNMYGFDE